MEIADIFRLGKVQNCISSDSLNLTTAKRNQYIFRSALFMLVEIQRRKVLLHQEEIMIIFKALNEIFLRSNFQ